MIWAAKDAMQYAVKSLGDGERETEESADLMPSIKLVVDPPLLVQVKLAAIAELVGSPGSKVRDVLRLAEAGAQGHEGGSTGLLLRFVSPWEAADRWTGRTV